MRIPNFVDDAQPFTPSFESYCVASIPFALYAAAAALPRRNLMSAPTPAVVECMRRLKGDVLILGVGGKMGPSLARMVKPASDLSNADTSQV